MKHVQSILFDLDGTLTDSAPGIVKAYEHAFKKMKVQVPSKEEIRLFIGSPLRKNIASCVPSENIEACCEFYFRYYDQKRVGFTDNSVYDGVIDALEAFKAHNKQMLIVTAKLSELALPIVNIFGLEPFFASVYGAARSGRWGDKESLIARAMNNNELAPETTVMVGDRSYDIIAAKHNGIRSVGVTWGYGSEDELRQAGADVIVSSPQELVEALCE